MEEVVFVAVLLVPLAIPRFPLPAILAALVLDAADQTIFQAVGSTGILDEYQSWLLPAVIAVAIPLVLLALRQTWRLPPPDREVRFDVDAHLERPAGASVRPRTDLRAVLSAATFEKVALVSIVVVIFSQILPGIEVGSLHLAAGVAVIVVANAAISLQRVRHGARYASTIAQFGAMALVNVAIVIVLGVIPGHEAARIPVRDSLYVLLLITLIVTLYDRYRVIGNRTRAESPGDRYGDGCPTQASHARERRHGRAKGHTGQVGNKGDQEILG